ncbi:hypothetical protein BGZ65_008867 [Modicella reniformis]|uniref:Uncharacterized protein n=1 Tax=Modicella reniformis TaxID=1440133 RepID=A0A9P6M842_9FUNG|nr:hypothetical protein BGZ65_008867 [Modicella reniformis]
MGSTTPPTNPAAPPPLVITTTNEDGNEVGFYYAVPAVNLNPAFTDADLFQDFNMMDPSMMDPLGEDFVWIENLFDDPPPEEAAANMAAMSVAAAAGMTSSPSTPNETTATSTMDLSATGHLTSAELMINDVSMGSAGVIFGQVNDSQPWSNRTYSQTMQG